MDMVIRGYEKKLQQNQRCEGCGIIIGPDSSVKNAFDVRDGEVVGVFHSRACYQNTCDEFAKYKEKMGGDKNE